MCCAVITYGQTKRAILCLKVETLTAGEGKQAQHVSGPWALGRGTDGCAGVNRLPPPAQDQHLQSSARHDDLEQRDGEAATGRVPDRCPQTTAAPHVMRTQPEAEPSRLQSPVRSWKPLLPDIRSSLGVGTGATHLSHTPRPQPPERRATCKAQRGTGHQVPNQERQSPAAQRRGQRVWLAGHSPPAAHGPPGAHHPLAGTPEAVPLSSHTPPCHPTGPRGNELRHSPNIQA